MDAPVRLDSLEQLEFHNRVTTTLPADPSLNNATRQVQGACFSRVQPEAVQGPGLVAASPEMLETLNLSPQAAAQETFAEVFSGSRLLEGMDPYAWCYGGHQFGNWAGQLGDGRAINLGEVKTQGGGHWVLQLKGAGLTPYSRMADGRAVLRSSVREFLCSEAMFHLGVPTTRALSLVTTGEPVLRDMFYDGNAKTEPGAVVCRMAPSFVRFGNFEIHAARGELEILKLLADFTLGTEFPELGDPGQSERPEAIYAEWFAEICRRTADLMVHWMRVGFVHGVMNTDNMSILGLTIDYGPYGWLEDYDLNWTPNTTDANGRRYCYGNQPSIAMWNLHKLANAIYPLINDAEPLEQSLRDYSERFNQQQQRMLANKIGLVEAQDKDDKLVSELHEILQLTETDMTLFFRTLASLDSEQASDEDDHARLGHAYYDPDSRDREYRERISSWLSDWRACLKQHQIDEASRNSLMNKTNPKYVLRNYLAQVAIDQAETGDYDEVNRLLDVMRKPYDDQPEYESYGDKRPEWARHRAGCSMLSCSS